MQITLWFFAADDGVHGIEPWKSDGTANGTQLIKDITPGRQNGTPTDMISYNGKVIFEAFQSGSGAVWSTDGSSNGTIKLADMIIENTGKNHTEVSNKLLFVGFTSGFGYELCMTDGTPAGTKLALDINKGLFSSSPDRFTIKDTSLFFIATDDKKGSEVYSIAPLHFTSTLSATFADNLISKPSGLLYQNAPNPFVYKTTIQYTLPDNYKYASHVFADASGHVLKTYNLYGKGANILNIIPENFTPGTYFYSLVIDGEVISTKTCVIAK